MAEKLPKRTLAQLGLVSELKMAGLGFGVVETMELAGTLGALPQLTANKKHSGRARLVFQSRHLQTQLAENLVPVRVEHHGRRRPIVGLVKGAFKSVYDLTDCRVARILKNLDLCYPLLHHCLDLLASVLENRLVTTTKRR